MEEGKGGCREAESQKQRGREPKRERDAERGKESGGGGREAQREGEKGRREEEEEKGVD